MKEHNININSALYVTFDNTNSSQKFLPFIEYFYEQKRRQFILSKECKNTKRQLFERSLFHPNIIYLTEIKMSYLNFLDNPPSSSNFNPEISFISSNRFEVVHHRNKTAYSDFCQQLVGLEKLHCAVSLLVEIFFNPLSF